MLTRGPAKKTNAADWMQWQLVCIVKPSLAAEKNQTRRKRYSTKKGAKKEAKPAPLGIVKSASVFTNHH